MQVPRWAGRGGEATRSARGFTVPEVLIVMAVVASIAAIAIPNLVSARVRTSETGAVATLRAISNAEAQFQRAARADVDMDGVGEFGLLRELAGATGVRTARDGSSTASPLRPALLPDLFRSINSNGEVKRGGFHFRAFLPNAAGQAVGESGTTSLRSVGEESIDPELAERRWCAYAWPTEQALHGARTFFASANVVTTSNAPAGRHIGRGAIGVADAGLAFECGGDTSCITGVVACDALGRDGSIWRIVQ